MKPLAGKVALVTGASEGLGAEFARACAAAGARVVVTARRGDLLDSVAGDLPDGLAVTGDLAVEDDRQRVVDTAVAAYGGIDVLVNNAAVAAAGPAVDEPVSTVEGTVAVNLTAVMRLAQLVAPGMIERGSGSIVNVSSISALRSFDRYGLASYAASKAGVLGLTGELAAQWGAHGVRVNALAPGWFPGGTNGYLRNEEVRDWIGSYTALRRPGWPDELASAMLFLASDAGSYVTGQVLAVDGGWTAF